MKITQAPAIPKPPPNFAELNHGDTFLLFTGGDQFMKVSLDGMPRYVNLSSGTIHAMAAHSTAIIKIEVTATYKIIS